MGGAEPFGLRTIVENEMRHMKGLMESIHGVWGACSGSKEKSGYHTGTLNKLALLS